MALTRIFRTNNESLFGLLVYFFVYLFLFLGLSRTRTGRGDCRRPRTELPVRIADAQVRRIDDGKITGRKYISLSTLKSATGTIRPRPPDNGGGIEVHLKLFTMSKPTRACFKFTPFPHIFAVATVSFPIPIFSSDTVYFSNKVHNAYGTCSTLGRRKISQPLNLPGRT